MNIGEFKNMIANLPDDEDLTMELTRDDHEIARTQHQWVKFVDSDFRGCLMFVFNSTVIMRRQKNNHIYNDRDLFDIGGQKASLELYGYPCIIKSRNGLEIVTDYPVYLKYLNGSYYEVISGDEVEQTYDYLCNVNTKRFKAAFKDEKK